MLQLSRLLIGILIKTLQFAAFRKEHSNAGKSYSSTDLDRKIQQDRVDKAVTQAVLSATTSKDEEIKRLNGALKAARASNADSERRFDTRLQALTTKLEACEAARKAGEKIKKDDNKTIKTLLQDAIPKDGAIKKLTSDLDATKKSLEASEEAQKLYDVSRKQELDTVKARSQSRVVELITKLQNARISLKTIEEARDRDAEMGKKLEE